MATSALGRWLLVLLIAAAYWPVLGQEFLRWDDRRNLLNPDFDSPSVASLSKYWQRPHGDLYIPVTYTFWAGVAAVGRADTPDDNGVRLNPYLFHAANLALHIVASILVLQIMYRLFGSGLAAIAGAIVFALHPVQVESVAWISGAKDLLCGMWCLLAIYLHVLRRQGGSHSRLLLAGTLTAFVLALGSKPAAVALPVILLSLDLLLLKARPRQACWEALGLLGLAAPFVAVGLAAQPANVVEYRPPVYLRPVVALDALAFYAGKVMAPLQPCIDYGRRPDWVLSNWQGYVTWLVPAAALAGGWLARRRLPALGAGLAMTAVALLPVLGLVSFDFQSYSTVADHYLYLGLVGVALAVAGALARATPRAAAMAAVLLALGLGSRTWLQTWVWRDDRTLFEHTLAVNPGSLAGLVNTGHVHYDRGEFGAAAQYYERALAIYPRDVEVLVANGLVQEKLGKPQEAMALLRRAIARNPLRPSSHYYLGNAAMHAGELQLAREEFRRAIELKGDYAQAWCNLGGVELLSGNRVAARMAFGKALEYQPDLEPARQGLARSH